MPFVTTKPEPTVVSEVHSVVTGDPVRISASSFGTFKDCTRKWYYNKIYGLTTPQTESTALGGVIHERLEEYLLTGEIGHNDRPALIAREGLHMLPRTPVEVEVLIEGYIGPLPYVGYIDMLDRNRSKEPQPYVKIPAGIAGNPEFDPTAPWIGDHKSTKDRRWMKTREQLEWNPQLLFYGWAAFKDDPPDHIRVSHLYYLTAGTRGSERVDAQIPWDRAVDMRDKFEKVAVQMAKLASNDDPNTVPFSLQACRKYGGCPFQSRCSKRYGAKATLDLTTTEMTMDRKAKLAALKAKKAAKRAGRPTSTPTPPPEETPAEADPEPPTASTLAPGPQEVVPPDAAPQLHITDALLDEVAERYALIAAEMNGEPKPVILTGMMARDGIPASFREEVVKRANGVAPTPVALLEPEETPEPNETPAATPKPSTPAPAPAATSKPPVEYRVDPTAYYVDPNDEEPDPAKVAAAVHDYMVARGDTPDAKPDAAGNLIASVSWVNTVIKIVVSALYPNKKFRITTKRIRGIAKSGAILSLWVINSTEQSGVTLGINVNATNTVERGMHKPPGGTPATVGTTAEAPRQPAPAQPEAPEAPVDPGSFESPKKSFVPLYVDCGPQDPPLEPIRLEHLLNSLMAAVAREMNVDHYLCTPYNEGAKLLASKVALALANGSSFRETCAGRGVTMSSQHPAFPFVFPILTKMRGAYVVRAWR